MGRYMLLEVLKDNFAISFVVVYPNDTQFHKYDEVSHCIVSSIRTPMATGGALEDVIERWSSRIEDRLANEIEDDADDFDNQAKESFGNEFNNVFKDCFDAKQGGEYQTTSSLIAWISGSKNKDLRDIK